MRSVEQSAPKTTSLTRLPRYTGSIACLFSPSRINSNSQVTRQPLQNSNTLVLENYLAFLLFASLFLLSAAQTNGQTNSQQVAILPQMDPKPGYDPYDPEKLTYDARNFFMIMGIAVGTIVCLGCYACNFSNINNCIKSIFTSFYGCFNDCYQQSLTKKKDAASEMIKLLPKPTATRQPVTAQSDNDLERQIEEEWGQNGQRRWSCLPCCGR